MDGEQSILFRVRGVILAGIWLMTAPSASGQAIYFSETNFGTGWIRRINPDGTDLRTLVETSGGIRGLELAPQQGTLLWTDVDGDAILRAPLSDPEAFEVLVSGVGFGYDVAVDESRAKLAWIDGEARVVSVSNLDGSDAENIVAGTISTALAINTASGELYFEERATARRGAIRRIGLDGSGLVTIIDNVPTASDLAIDAIHQYVYWGSTAGFDNTGGIYRCRFDGTGFEEVFKPDAPLSDATTLTIDPATGTIYFGVRSNADVTDIYRMGLDGSDPTLIAGGFHLVPHMTFVIPAPAALAPLAIAGLLAARRRR